MQIKLNGEDYPLEGAVSVAALVQKLALDERKIAIERNFEIVPRIAYATTQLAAGDEVEIVHFIGGG